MHEDHGPRERLRRDGDLVRDPRRSIAIGAGMLAGVAVLAIVVASDVDAPPLLQGLDDAWRRTALGWHGWIRSVGEAFERLGAGVVMVPLRIVVAIWLVVRRRRWDLAAWLLGWILADVATAALKPGLARARPTAMDPENPFTSFPSAHAKTAAQVAIGLVLVASNPWRSRRGWFALAAVWIALMATSRTVVDHHWLSDVVAGPLLGAGAALLAAAATQLVRDGRARAQMPDPGRRDT